MAEKHIYVKLVKEWGGFPVGAVIRFGYNKGMGRIEAGEGVKVEKQLAVNDPPPKVVKVETATAEPKDEPEAEKAVLTIERQPKDEVVADTKSEPRRRGRSKSN